MQLHKFICFFLAIMMLATVATGCSDNNHTNQLELNLPVPEEVEYVEYEVTRGTFEKEVVAVGHFHPLSSEKVVLEESGAVLKEDITVKAGTYVEAGDVLAIFALPYDESDVKVKQLEYDRAMGEYQSRISQYNSQIEAKRAQITTLSGTDKQVAELELESMLIDKQMYDAQQSTKLATQLEALEEMKAKKDPYVLYAPISGIVNYVIKNGRTGTEVSNGTVVFTIYEISVENVLLRCDTMDYTSLIYGMETRVFCTQAGAEFDTTGRVVASPSALTEEDLNNNDFTYIKIDDIKILEQFRDYCIDNQKSPTSLAIAVRGISISMEDVLLVNTKAINFIQNGETERTTYDSCLGWVYVLDENGSTARRDILIGPTDGNTACILDGLEVGDVIVNVS